MSNNKESTSSRIIEFLKSRPGIKLKAKEIAQGLLEDYPHYTIIGKSLSQLSSEISPKTESLQKSGVLRDTTTSPYTWFYPINGGENLSLSNQDSNEEESLYNEKELYPILSKYLLESFKIKSKRINESKMTGKSQKGTHRWRFPDLVGVEDLFQSKKEDKSVIEYLQSAHVLPSTLWSFEVKISLSVSNVRESFFQTVSNSSWANYGYLVCSKIEEDSDLMVSKELKTLSGLHGIGVIELDVDNPKNSRILFQARKRDILDGDTVIQLARVSSEFGDVLEATNNFHKTFKLEGNCWEIDD